MPSAVGRAHSPFIEELQRLLVKHRLSWRKLAELTGYHPSWLSKVRNGTPPSADLVARCDEALGANGALIALAAVGRTRRPAQLPASPAGFVGRHDELRRMREVLTDRAAAAAPAVVAVDGPPGAGKTAAVLHCAHDIVRTDPERYSDGQLYVNLNGYSQDGSPMLPESALEEFLIALGVSTRDVPAGIEQRAALYRSLLAARELLIVLDNASSSEQVEPLLPGSVGCAVMVTSRRRLTGLAMRVAVERVPLGPMSEEESLTVLRRVTGGARADVGPDSLAALARWCGHLPLALRIAAERVVTHRFHSVDELVDELATERQRLDALADDDSVTVRTVFEWSYRELNGDEARMFRSLGLHRGPCVSVEAAAALAGVSPLRARRLLQSLAAVHLLEGAPNSRYQFHDLIRLYAVECAEADGDADGRRAAVARLLDWYLHTTVAGGRALAPFRLSPLELGPPAPGTHPLRFAAERDALRWYDVEAPNFAAVVALAAEHRMYEIAWQLAIALFDYLRLLRNPGELWLTTVRLACAAAEAAGARSAQGWVETSLAEAHRWLRQYDDSRRHFERGLALQREAGDWHGQAWAMAGLGFLAVDQEQWEPAHDRAKQARVLFRQVGDRHGEASAMSTLADAYHGWRRHEKAFEVLQDSLRIFEEIENHDGQGLTLAKMAETHLARGEHEQALRFLDRSLRARRLAGSLWAEADGLARRGRALQSLGRAADARTAWEAALALYEKVDDPRVADIRAYLEGGAADIATRVLSRPAW